MTALQVRLETFHVCPVLNDDDDDTLNNPWKLEMRGKTCRLARPV